MIFTYCSLVYTLWQCTKVGKRQLYVKGEAKHKTIQKRGIHKIENKNTKQENKRKNNIKNISPVIGK
jgi:hypothetical protein